MAILSSATRNGKPSKWYACWVAVLQLNARTCTSVSSTHLFCLFVCVFTFSSARYILYELYIKIPFFYTTTNFYHFNDCLLPLVLHDMGYRVSPQLLNTIIYRFDHMYRRSLKFDDFITVAVMLKNYTDAFRVRDHQQTGNININYDDFLSIVFGCKP